MKKSSGTDSIKGMNSFVFNAKTGRYEKADGFITGKSPQQIAEEYGITEIRARQYAKEKKVPYLGKDGSVFAYVFDAAAEKAFVNRKVKPGPVAVEKPPKVPGKPGRPRKHPVKALDIVPKKGSGSGRPRKGK